MAEDNNQARLLRGRRADVAMRRQIVRIVELEKRVEKLESIIVGLKGAKPVEIKQTEPVQSLEPKTRKSKKTE